MSNRHQKDAMTNIMEILQNGNNNSNNNNSSSSSVVVTIGHPTQNNNSSQQQPTKIESVAVHALKNNLSLQVPSYLFSTATATERPNNNNFVAVLNSNSSSSLLSSNLNNPLMMMMQMQLNNNNILNFSNKNNNGGSIGMNNNYDSCNDTFHSHLFFESCLAMCPQVPQFSQNSDKELIFLRSLIAYASCPSAFNLNILLDTTTAAECDHKNVETKHFNSSSNNNKQTSSNNSYVSIISQLATIALGLWRWGGGSSGEKTVNVDHEDVAEEDSKNENQQQENPSDNITSQQSNKSNPLMNILEQSREQTRQKNQSSTSSLLLFPQNSNNKILSTNQNIAVSSSSNVGKNILEKISRKELLVIQQHMNPLLCLPECSRWLAAICFVADEYYTGYLQNFFFSSQSNKSKINVDADDAQRKNEEEKDDQEKNSIDQFMSGPLRPEDFYWEKILKKKSFDLYLADERKKQKLLLLDEDQKKKKNKSGKSVEKATKNNAAANDEDLLLLMNKNNRKSAASSSTSASTSSSSSDDDSSDSSSSSSTTTSTSTSTKQQKTKESNAGKRNYFTVNDNKLFKLDFGLKLLPTKHFVASVTSEQKNGDQHDENILDHDLLLKSDQDDQGTEIVDEIVSSSPNSANFIPNNKTRNNNNNTVSKFQNKPRNIDDIVYLRQDDYQIVSQPCVLWFDETKMTSVNNNNNHHNNSKDNHNNANTKDHYFSINNKMLLKCLCEELGSGGFSLRGRPDQRLAGIFVKDSLDLNICRVASEVLKKAATKNNLRHKTNGGLEPPKTGIVGHYDYLTNPTDKKCRLTAFTREHLAELEWAVAPLLRRLDEIYKTKAPDHFRQQAISIPPHHRLFDTCFSTVTVNDTFRTAQHTDSGDFRSGLGIVAVIGGNWKGCHLALPATGKAFKMDVGDVILFDTSLPHGNTEWVFNDNNNHHHHHRNNNNDDDDDDNELDDGETTLTTTNEPPPPEYSRISIVAYLRSGLISQVCEAENEKRLLEKQHQFNNLLGEVAKEQTDSKQNEQTGKQKEGFMQMASKKTGNRLVDLMLTNATFAASPYSSTALLEGNRSSTTNKNNHYSPNQKKSYLWYYEDEVAVSNNNEKEEKDQGNTTKMPKYEFWTEGDEKNNKAQNNSNQDNADHDDNNNEEDNNKQSKKQNDVENLTATTTPDAPTPPLWLPPKLVETLNEPQKCALIFSHLRMMKKTGSVLALSMGLGKSLLGLSIAFSQLVLAGGGGAGPFVAPLNYSTHGKILRNNNSKNSQQQDKKYDNSAFNPFRYALILTPKSVIPHWQNEAEKKWPEAVGLKFAKVFVLNGSNNNNNNDNNNNNNHNNASRMRKKNSSNGEDFDKQIINFFASAREYHQQRWSHTSREEHFNEFMKQIEEEDEEDEIDDENENENDNEDEDEENVTENGTKSKIKQEAADSESLANNTKNKNKNHKKRNSGGNVAAIPTKSSSTTSRTKSRLHALHALRPVLLRNGAAPGALVILNPDSIKRFFALPNVPEPSLVLFDEGHRGSTQAESAILKALGQHCPTITSKILLSGTPLQNAPIELYRLVDWVNPLATGLVSEISFRNSVAPLDEYLRVSHDTGKNTKITSTSMLLGINDDDDDEEEEEEEENNIQNEDDELLLLLDEVSGGKSKKIVKNNNKIIQQLQDQSTTTNFRLAGAIRAQEYLANWMRGTVFRAKISSRSNVTATLRMPELRDYIVVCTWSPVQLTLMIVMAAAKKVLLNNNKTKKETNGERNNNQNDSDDANLMKKYQREFDEIHQAISVLFDEHRGYQKYLKLEQQERQSNNTTQITIPENPKNNCNNAQTEQRQTIIHLPSLVHEAFYSKSILSKAKKTTQSNIEKQGKGLLKIGKASKRKTNKNKKNGDDDQDDESDDDDGCDADEESCDDDVLLLSDDDETDDEVSVDRSNSRRRRRRRRSSSQADAVDRALLDEEDEEANSETNEQTELMDIILRQDAVNISNNNNNRNTNNTIHDDHQVLSTQEREKVESVGFQEETVVSGVVVVVPRRPPQNNCLDAVSAPEHHRPAHFSCHPLALMNYDEVRFGIRYTCCGESAFLYTLMKNYLWMMENDLSTHRSKNKNDDDGVCENDGSMSMSMMMGGGGGGDGSETRRRDRNNEEDHHDADYLDISSSFLQHSNKLAVLLQIAHDTTKINKNSLIIFTQYRTTMFTVQNALLMAGISSTTLHGDLTVAERDLVVKNFTNSNNNNNQHSNPHAHRDQDGNDKKTNDDGAAQQEAPEGKVLVITTKVGGVGIDLTAACVAVMFEPWWNPQVDLQAIARIFRPTQKSPVVTVYRLCVEGTMEETILLETQLRKLALFACVVDQVKLQGTSAGHQQALVHLDQRDYPEPLKGINTTRRGLNKNEGDNKKNFEKKRPLPSLPSSVLMLLEQLRHPELTNFITTSKMAKRSGEKLVSKIFDFSDLEKLMDKAY